VLALEWYIWPPLILGTAAIFTAAGCAAWIVWDAVVSALAALKEWIKEKCDG
jgi:hypothetical protein